MWDFLFFLESILLGVGLAMDAFSVSLANGLRESCMPKLKMLGVAGTFGVFQGLMPLIGWVCVHTVLVYFTAFEAFIPWIALALLGFIGGKMLVEGLRGECDCEGGCRLGFFGLVMQGVATSIDALSVGFTIAEYEFLKAFVAVLIIAFVTFLLCLFGIRLGKTMGMKFSGKATAFGGIILILIGLEIFITGIIG